MEMRHDLAGPPVVVDVTDEDFERVVLDGSKERPVVVDLWAEWCGPCKTLGPILEKVARERGGEFLLAKVDVDAQRVGNELLAAVRSQGIPTVVAFRDGAPVSMFIGSYPEEYVNEFVDALLPSAADRVAEEAQAEETAGDIAGAEERYRAALAEDVENRDARVGLARILAERGELDEARELATPLLPDEEAERVLSITRVRGWNELDGSSGLERAKAIAAQGRWRDGLELMLAALADDRDAAREAMVDVFRVLGDEDPLVPEYRRRLTNALF